MQYEIIDFHTHPFMDAASNICRFKEKGVEDTVSYLRGLGVSKICGSVIGGEMPGATPWERIQESNRMALELQEKYAGFYVPGFHVHRRRGTGYPLNGGRKTADFRRKSQTASVVVRKYFTGRILLRPVFSLVMRCSQPDSG